MLQKVRENQGLTLVEMLCATVILLLLGLLINTGLHMAVSNYRRMVLQSESQLLMSTLSDVLADELRYAKLAPDPSPSPAVPPLEVLSYSSGRYGSNAKLKVCAGDNINGGQIYVEDASASPSPAPYYILPAGSYGGETWACGVKPDDLKITYDSGTGLFNVELKVTEMTLTKDASGNMIRAFVSPSPPLAETKFTVRRLNSN